MRPVVFLVFLTLFSCANRSVQTSSEGSNLELDLNIRKVVLDNGLTVLMHHNPSLPLASVYVYYEVGSKHERPGITGASHYLEHMMFKGAKKYGPGEFDRLVEGNGGNNNAYTTYDMTVYYERIPSSALHSILDLEADRMNNLLLEKNSFEQERKVVLEERKYRYENSPNGKLYLHMMKNMFRGTPYGTSVIGTIKDIKNVTRDQMYAFFKRFYAPNNAILVVAGDMDLDDTEDVIRKSFGDLPASTTLPKKGKPTAYKAPLPSGQQFHIHGEAKDPMIMLAYKGSPIGERKGFVLDLLSSILGDGDSSYLRQSFVLSKSPKMTNLYVGNYTIMHAGVFFIGGQLAPGVSRSVMRRKILGRMRKSCDQAITERTAQKVKNQYLLKTLSSLETNSGVAEYVGDRQAYQGDYLFYRKELGIYNSITIKEIKDACYELIKQRPNYFTVWRKNKKRRG